MTQSRRRRERGSRGRHRPRRATCCPSCKDHRCHEGGQHKGTSFSLSLSASPSPPSCSLSSVLLSVCLPVLSSVCLLSVCLPVVVYPQLTLPPQRRDLIRFEEHLDSVSSLSKASATAVSCNNLKHLPQRSSLQPPPLLATVPQVPFQFPRHGPAEHTWFTDRYDTVLLSLPPSLLSGCLTHPTLPTNTRSTDTYTDTGFRRCTVPRLEVVLCVIH